MKFEIGAMTVGDILDRGLKIFMARLPTFYVINLIVLTPLLLYQLILPAILFSGEPNPAVMIGFAFGSLGVLLLTFILAPIGAAASLHVISQEFIDDRVTVGQAFAFAFRHFLNLLGVSILVGLILFVGLMLCIVPFFFFWMWYAFAAQVVVVEGLSGMDALNRSKRLGEGFYGRVIGVLLLMAVIGLIGGLVGSMLNQLAPPMEVVQTPLGPQPVLKSYPLYALAQVVNFLINVAVQSYAAVCVTLLYFDLRIRKEGYDLELAARKSLGEEKEEEPGLGPSVPGEGAFTSRKPDPQQPGQGSFTPRRPDSQQEEPGLP